MKNILVVAHKFLPQPDDDLVFYLNSRKKPNILHVYHSFNDVPDRCSYAVWYKFGRVYRKYQTSDYKKFPEFVIYLKEGLFTILLILRSKIVWDSYIGMDGLCVSFGNFMKLLGKARKTIYWVIDYVPKGRFKNEIKNKIYHFINRTSYEIVDEVWDLSPVMSKARKKFQNIQRANRKISKVVPYGMWLARITRYSYENCQQNTLAFMGHLIEKQGVQLVIKAIPKIIKSLPSFRFKIIGDGNFKNKLVELAISLKVMDYCDFMGKIGDSRIMEKEVAKSCLAIAPYIKKLDKWTAYTDPGKVKTYLGCGVPVLLTKVPWNAGEIDKAGCGKIITEDEENISENVVKYMEEETNRKARERAIEYSLNFDWRSIFSKLFDDI